MIEEGTKAWNLISQNNHQVHWENVVFEIEELFMKIAHCSTRSLTHEVLSHSLSLSPKFIVDDSLLNLKYADLELIL